MLVTNEHLWSGLLCSEGGEGAQAWREQNIVSTKYLRSDQDGNSEACILRERDSMREKLSAYEMARTFEAIELGATEWNIAWN